MIGAKVEAIRNPVAIAVAALEIRNAVVVAVAVAVVVVVVAVAVAVAVVAVRAGVVIAAPTATTPLCAIDTVRTQAAAQTALTAAPSSGRFL